MARGHIELVHAPDIPETSIPATGWPPGATVKILSADPETGAFTGLVRLPPGWQRPAGQLSATVESMVVDGELQADGVARRFGFYEHAPRGGVQRALATASGATLLFFARDSAPHFIAAPPPDDDAPPSVGNGGRENAEAERIELDTERMAWSYSTIPGPPDGHVHKILRRDPRTGGMTVMLSTVPHREYPALEFHDCVEEYYVIEGEVWLGNSGLMRAGSYFWRPPFITHGPFSSRTGAVSVVWVPSALVNHVPLGPASSPEENLARFVSAGGERVL